MYDLDKTNNAVFSLCYHFITVVKYRQKIFADEKLISDLKKQIVKIAADFEVVIVEQECGIDHIHVLFRAKPTLNITKFINIMKGHTSRELRKKYNDLLRDKLWGDNLWSPSYFLATTGNVTIDILKEYVESQRKLRQ
jgi:putative transposase